jgi:hypothetical protein
MTAQRPIFVPTRTRADANTDVPVPPIQICRPWLDSAAVLRRLRVLVASL